MNYLTTHTDEAMLLDFGFGNEILFNKKENKLYLKRNYKQKEEIEINAENMTINEFEDIIKVFYKKLNN